MATNKFIIQCELYQVRKEATNTSKVISNQGGLCINCIKADTCQLPGKNEGIWHCEEYE
jgi:hypothetical protein